LHKLFLTIFLDGSPEPRSDTSIPVSSQPVNFLNYEFNSLEKQ